MSEFSPETSQQLMQPGEAALQALMHSVAPEDEGFIEFLEGFCGPVGAVEAAERYELIIQIARSTELPQVVFNEISKEII